MSGSLLTSLVWIPLLGMGLIALAPERLARLIALGTSLVGTALAVALYFAFDGARISEMQFAVSYPWMENWGVRFALGVDGISFPLVLLSKFMVPIALLTSWYESRRTKLFLSCFLFLDAAMAGTFLATDIFVFYVFWEAMLIPMLLLIGIWGSDKRIFASLKFFIFTFAGSIFMLVAILYLFFQHHAQFGTYSAAITDLLRVHLDSTPIWRGCNVADFVFWGFTLAFLIKVPLFPVHTWLPDAHVQAPTGGSVLLAAVLLKMGTYGLMRFSIPFAPEAFVHFAPLLGGLSLAGILYGAWVAFQQEDMKKLVAYSSVSHLGFVVLGLATLTPEGLMGAVLQNLNHGLSTGALFALVGMLYERRHTRKFSDFGGLAAVMPWYSVFLVLVACSSMGVPGLNGFLGEFLVFFGAYQANWGWALIAVPAVVFGALYTLTLVYKVLFGPVTVAENRGLKDLSPRDWAVLVPLAVFIVWLGIAPGFLLNKIRPTVDTYWAQVTKASVVTQAKPVQKGRRS